MKKILSLSFVALIAATLFVGCKKGENDPGLSLKSRKARLKGVWNLTEGTDTYTNEDGDVTTTTYNGTTVTYTYGGTPTTPTAYSESLEFTKDGFIYTQVDVYGTSIIEGTWAFAGKDKGADISNKEVLLLNTTKMTYTPVGGTAQVETSTGVDYFSMTLDKLSSKELVTSDTYTNTDEDGTTSNASTKTYEKE